MNTTPTTLETVGQLHHAMLLDFRLLGILMCVFTLLILVTIWVK